MFYGDGAGLKAAGRACSIIMPFLRDTSDIKFAFVTGGKDPDEILKTSGTDAMNKIINDAVPLVDFMWQSLNNNFLVSTPGGRVQAEKFLKKELEKIVDPELKSEYEKEFNNRIFNNWHKWNRQKSAVQIKLPDIDTITKNTLIYIVNTYPELAEQYLEFLGTLGIDFDGTTPELNLDKVAAEKYIVSLKLQRYIEKLKLSKAELIKSGDESTRDEILGIDSDIAAATEKLEKLIML